MDRYFSYRHLVTDECHIFHGKYNPTEKKCSIDKDRTSICQKMTIKTAKEQEAEEVFECFNEQEAREKCARLGREVCGICVSNLYSNVEMLIDPYD
ncbi:hypothetical protein BZG29_18455 [Janthinobacterium sp. LM6]|nr:hypothetical protein BZG29_18455 [Janthinobacterium sp. LM6]